MVSKIEISKLEPPQKNQSPEIKEKHLIKKIDFLIEKVELKKDNRIEVKKLKQKIETAKKEEKLTVIDEVEKFLDSDEFEAQIEKSEKDPLLIEKTEAALAIAHYFKKNPETNLKTLKPENLEGKIETSFLEKLKKNPALWAIVKSLAGDSLDICEVISSENFWKSPEGKMDALVGASGRDLSKAQKTADDFYKKNPRAVAYLLGGAAIATVLGWFFLKKDKSSSTPAKKSGWIRKTAFGALGLGAAVLGFKMFGEEILKWGAKKIGINPEKIKGIEDKVDKLTQKTEEIVKDGEKIPEKIETFLERYGPRTKKSLDKLRGAFRNGNTVEVVNYLEKIRDGGEKEGVKSVVEIKDNGEINLSLICAAGKTVGGAVGEIIKCSWEVSRSFNDDIMENILRATHLWDKPGGSMIFLLESSLFAIGAPLGFVKGVASLGIRPTKGAIHKVGRVGVETFKGATITPLKVTSSIYRTTRKWSASVDYYRTINKLHLLSLKEAGTTIRHPIGKIRHSREYANLPRYEKHLAQRIKLTSELKVYAQWRKVPQTEIDNLDAVIKKCKEEYKLIKGKHLLDARHLEEAGYNLANKKTYNPKYNYLNALKNKKLSPSERGKLIKQAIANRATEIQKTKGISNRAATSEAAKELKSIAKKAGKLKTLRGLSKYLGPTLIGVFGIFEAADAVAETNSEIKDLKWKSAKINTGTAVAELAAVETVKRLGTSTLAAKTAAIVGGGAGVFSLALTGATLPPLYMANGALDSAKEAKMKPIDWLRKLGNDSEKLFHAIITTPDELSVGDTYRAFFTTATIEDVSAEKIETRQKIWEALLRLEDVGQKEKTVRLKYITNKFPRLYINNLAQAKKVWRDSQIYFENYKTYAGDEKFAKISTEKDIETLEVEIKNREIKMSHSSLAYALFEAAKILGYEGNGTLEELKKFFHEDYCDEKGIYWNGKQWMLNEDGLEWDDEMGRIGVATTRRIIKRLKENKENVFASRNRSILDSITGKQIKTNGLLQTRALQMAGAMEIGLQKFFQQAKLARQKK